MTRSDKTAKLCASLALTAFRHVWNVWQGVLYVVYARRSTETMETKQTKGKARRHGDVVGYVRLSRWGNSTVMAVPKALRDALRLEPGQYLRVSAQGKRLVVEKAA
jgi:hypothetical protein